MNNLSTDTLTPPGIGSARASSSLGVAGLFIHEAAERARLVAWLKRWVPTESHWMITEIQKPL